MAISSAVAMADFADFGIGNGVVNVLALVFPLKHLSIFTYIYYQ
jgi:hypothetical protein